MSSVAEAPAAAPAAATPTADRLVILASSGDLERTWATLILASTGAAMGKDVTVFFTFWGLFTLVRPGAGITGESWMQRMLAVMNPGGTQRLKLSRLNFAGMGPAMMRSIARRHGIAQPGELLDLAREMGVKLIPCQMTMDMMGLRREDLVDGLEEPAGATTALLAAEGATALFI